MSQYSAINDVDQLQALYGVPAEASMLKVATRITEPYCALLEASPFFMLATVGPEGLDCSPRGELGGAFRIVDDKTIIIPDRRGNNRIDTLRNIVRDPRIAALFLIPGSGTTIRLNGTAIVTTDETLLASFEKEGKRPRSAVVITVGEIYTQCARAVVRADLWNRDNHVAKNSIPTPGEVLKHQASGNYDAETYDREWAGRAAKTMW